MEVILVKPVRKLGKVGEKVKVKNGYGRNYLLPNSLAVRASKDNLHFFSSKQEELEEKNRLVKQKADEALKVLAEKQVVFITEASADGKLFGSVSAKSIAKKISELINYEINYNNIFLKAPLKSTGSYSIKLALHPEVVTDVAVIIARSASEAQEVVSNSNIQDEPILTP